MKQHHHSSRAIFFAIQPIIWLSISSALMVYSCIFFWNMNSFAGTIISAILLAYSMIKLKGSFFYIRNRTRMYDMFTEAIKLIGYAKVSDVMAKYMDTICGTFIARMVLVDTGNIKEWDNLKAKARFAKKKKILDKNKNISNYL